MSQITVEMGKYTIGGTFSYQLRRNGVGEKSVIGGVNTLSQVWDLIKADLGTYLGSETVQSVTIVVQAN